MAAEELDKINVITDLSNEGTFVFSCQVFFMYVHKCANMRCVKLPYLVQSPALGLKEIRAVHTFKISPLSVGCWALKRQLVELFL